MRSRLACSLVAALAACSRTPEPDASPKLAPAPPPSAPAGPPQPFGDAEIRARLREIASRYKNYQRVEGHPSWAPVDCISPLSAPPWMSASKEASTHGRKLYYTFTDDASAYANLRNRTGVTNPIGRVVVKESRAPVRAADGARDADTRTMDGIRYQAGIALGLFIMFKVDPTTPGTDAGWVYGSISADGREVLSAGNLEACTRCHKLAQNDRLFGPEPGVSPP